MTADATETILRLRDEHVFDPAPRQAELFRFHVPFDELTGGATCEQTLDAALRRGEQVALIGSSGSGKSSVVSYVLGPLVEDLAPLPIPVSLEAEEVATSPVAFAAHLVRTVARYIAYAQPADEDDARRILRRTTPTLPSDRRRPTKVSVAPSWMGVRLELAAELDSASSPSSPRSGAEVVEQARRILELIAARDLLPVLVFDDTDKWLQVSAPADSARLVDGFFRSGGSADRRGATSSSGDRSPRPLRQPAGVPIRRGLHRELRTRAPRAGRDGPGPDPGAARR